MDEINTFKREFTRYKDQKETEFQEFDLKYGKVLEENNTTVTNFKEQITINVGNILRDVQDLKLQMTSLNLAKANNSASSGTVEA